LPPPPHTPQFPRMLGSYKNIDNAKDRVKDDERRPGD